VALLVFMPSEFVDYETSQVFVISGFLSLVTGNLCIVLEFVRSLDDIIGASDGGHFCFETVARGRRMEAEEWFQKSYIYSACDVSVHTRIAGALCFWSW
jgi:hypothetical protein